MCKDELPKSRLLKVILLKMTDTQTDKTCINEIIYPCRFAGGQ